MEGAVSGDYPRNDIEAVPHFFEPRIVETGQWDVIGHENDLHRPCLPPQVRMRCVGRCDVWLDHIERDCGDDSGACKRIERRIVILRSLRHVGAEFGDRAEIGRAELRRLFGGEHTGIVLRGSRVRRLRRPVADDIPPPA